MQVPLYDARIASTLLEGVHGLLERPIALPEQPETIMSRTKAPREQPEAIDQRDKAVCESLNGCANALTPCGRSLQHRRAGLNGAQAF